MKVLIQRVANARVDIRGETVGKISQGLLLLVGIEKHDSKETLQRMANKVCSYRVFADAEDKMNLNVQDIDGEILAISQFTLAANTQKGLRPSFSSAAPPEQAQSHYQDFVDILKQSPIKIETGRFGADMQVSLLNDGPVTFLLEM